MITIGISLRCGHILVGNRKHRCCPVCRKDLSPYDGWSKKAAIKHIRECREAQAQVPE